MERLGRVAIVSAAMCLMAMPGGLAQKTGPDPIYLGVDVPPSLYGGVRIVFRYWGGRWEPMPENPNSLDKEGDYYPNMGADYPQQVSWTVAFDGKKIGTLNTTQPVHFTERFELGKQIAVPNSVLPRIPDRAKRFDFKGFRPLVLVSRPNYADPDVWKPFRPTDAAIIKQVRTAYLHQYGPTAGCGSRCSAESILVEEGYRSSHGEMLIVVRPASEHRDEPGLERLVCDCESAGWDPEQHWFFVQRGAVRFVGIGLALIDAGDYDGDGVSEMLFWEPGEGDSKDGYVLLCPLDTSIHRFEIPGDPH
jgi:hypothetical protein